MNSEIKRIIKEANVYQWQIAKVLGVTAGTLTIWLRDNPLPDDRKRRIIEAIEKLTAHQ